MKIHIHNSHKSAVALLLPLGLVAAFFCQTSIVGAQGTAFTYQGQLEQGGNPANGVYDFRFDLFTVPTGGTSVSGFVTNAATPVSNGLFTVTLDFGTGVFDGTTYWMHIGVRTNSGGAFTSLSPRQELTPTPYAIFAEGASAGGLTGTIPSGVLAGGYGGVLNFTNPADSFAGNGAGLTNVNAATLGGLAASSFWKTTGNGGTTPGVNFAGTIDNNAFEMHVNSTRILRLEPDTRGLNAGNVVGGHPGNAIQQPGSGGDVIAGGGFSGGGNLIGTNSSGVFIGAGSLNKVGPNVNDSVVAGGYGNTNGAPDASIGGGLNNQIQSAAQYAHIGAGQGNIALGLGSAIGGGAGNVAGPYSAIGGGQYNGAGGSWAAIGGGYNNQAENFSTVAGGAGNFAGGIIGSNCAVGGGQGNFAGNSTSSMATVSGGYRNWAAGDGSFIGGGGYDGSIGGGNLAGGQASVIGGGLNNTNNGYAGTIGGGSVNTAGSTAATVGGGAVNSASGAYSTVAGGFNNSATYEATVGGGSGNIASGTASTLAGGFNNTAGGYYSTVAGGNANSAGGYASFAAGQYAQTTHDNTFIWGDGSQNPFTGASANNSFSVLASGGLFFYNGINGVHVDGSGNNNGTIDFGLKFGGSLTSGEGIASKRTAGGNQFGLDFYTSSANRMSIGPNGRVGIGTTTPVAKLDVNGEFLVVEGSSGVQCYFGDDGAGNDVQVGSLQSGITTVAFWNETDSAYMHIGCSSITIHGGADLAEPFPMANDGNEIPQGAVVVIDEANPGHLKMSDQPYDSHVAGVVSGANGIHPGIQLQQEGALEGGKNVALTGRVYVQADTSNGAIKPGDLLTTSRMPGHAMRVSNHARAQGAILGKAMTGLNQGKGMVLVLVTLQ
jgi:hypothetical protein